MNKQGLSKLCLQNLNCGGDCMALLKHELYKIYSNKSVKVLFIIIILLSGVYFAAQVHYGKVDSKVKSSIRNELEGKITRSKVEKASAEIRLLSSQMNQQSALTSDSQLMFKINAYAKLVSIDGAYWDKQRKLSKINPNTNRAVGFSNKNNMLWYNMIKSTSIDEFHYTAGWDDTVGYASKYGAVIIAAFILLGLSSVFCGEYASRMDAIILSTKYGKTKLIKAKLVAAGIYILVLILFFTILNLLGNIFVFGIDGWNAPLQCLNDFMYSPFKFTVIQYYFIQLLIHCVAGIAFGLFVLLVSSLSKTRIMAFFIGVFAFVSPFLIDNAIPMKKTLAELATSFSISWFMQVGKLFSSYRSYDIMDNPVLYPAAAIGVFVIFMLLCGIYIDRNFKNHGMN
jgi:hypothetical protein